MLAALPVETPPPRWLGAGLRAAFLGLVACGVLLAALLASGVADPPRAGPLLWEAGPLAPMQVGPRRALAPGQPVALPSPPYTLEISARFAAGSDPLAWWGVTFAPGLASIILHADGYFAMPPLLPEALSFFHICPVSHTNRLYIHVERSGAATVRINGEIAWQGQFPASQEARIYAGGAVIPGLLHIERIGLYAPRP